jgi:hypothetical protein
MIATRSRQTTKYTGSTGASAGAHFMSTNEFATLFDQAALENAQQMKDRLLDAHAFAVASHLSQIFLVTGFRPSDEKLREMIAMLVADDPPGQFHTAVRTIVNNTLAMAEAIHGARPRPAAPVRSSGE